MSFVLRCEECRTELEPPKPEPTRQAPSSVACSQCGASVPVAGWSAASTLMAPGTWLVCFSRGDDRELTLPQIEDALGASVIDEDTLVWREGLDEWLELGEVPELARLLPARSSRASRPRIQVKGFETRLSPHVTPGEASRIKTLPPPTPVLIDEPPPSSGAFTALGERLASADAHNKPAPTGTVAGGSAEAPTTPAPNATPSAARPSAEAPKKPALNTTAAPTSREPVSPAEPQKSAPPRPRAQAAQGGRTGGSPNLGPSAADQPSRRMPSAPKRPVTFTGALPPVEPVSSPEHEAPPSSKGTPALQKLVTTSQAPKPRHTKPTDEVVLGSPYGGLSDLWGAEFELQDAVPESNAVVEPTRVDIRPYAVSSSDATPELELTRADIRRPTPPRQAAPSSGASASTSNPAAWGASGNSGNASDEPTRVDIKPYAANTTLTSSQNDDAVPTPRSVGAPPAEVEERPAADLPMAGLASLAPPDVGSPTTAANSSTAPVALDPQADPRYGAEPPPRSARSSGKRSAGALLGLALVLGGLAAFAALELNERRTPEPASKQPTTAISPPAPIDPAPAAVPDERSMIPAVAAPPPQDDVATHPAPRSPRPTNQPLPASGEMAAQGSDGPAGAGRGPSLSGRAAADSAAVSASPKAAAGEPARRSMTTSPEPAEPGTEFDRAAAQTALTEASLAAARCRKPGDPAGMATVVVTFAPSGRVTSATVSGKPFAGTATGGCIATAMRSSSVPPFSGSFVRVGKTIRIE